MREGSLDAPIRHPIDWTNPDFTDPDKIDEELRRVFDICHGCRRCFNLCDSFPRLFDLIDESETGELDSVDSKDFQPVVDACTFCDMCFLTKCPYVPPHEFNLDFPHLMLRYRVAERQRGEVGRVRQELAKTDRNGKLAGLAPGIANWMTDEDNHGGRNMLRSLAGIDPRAALPKYSGETFVKRAARDIPAVNKDAPAHGRKAVIYATCFSNYNDPEIGAAARAVLARNGVETEVVYPSCCGMPMWEQGDIEQVARNAEKVAGEMREWIEKGYDIIAVVPSCALMLKFEWPLVLPGNEDVKLLSQSTFDITEYIVDIARKEGVAGGMTPLDGGVTLHLACHARAQNMGAKGADMLRLIPDTEVDVIERCSGHGGTWGVMEENFDTAMKVGRPVFRQGLKNGKAWVVSECPLASEHIRQGMDTAKGDDPAPSTTAHPIKLMAMAYGIDL
jgi:glycerol-3-phosphate dehydrogenase subunit C